MKLNYNKKYATIASYSVIAFAVCLLLVVLFLRFEGVVAILQKVLHVLMPVIWGFVFAYLLNPLMGFYERYLKKFLQKKKPHPKLIRGISVGLTVLTALAALTALFSIVIPQLVNSISNIINNMSDYFRTAEIWIADLMADNPAIIGFLNQAIENLQSTIMDYVKNPDLQNMIKSLSTGALNGVMGFLGGVWDFVLGFIIMVYLLSSKETFCSQAKKVLYAIFSQKTCKNLLSVVHMADDTFIGFISGKSLDSLIIGFLCFFVMSILQMPYAVLISVLIGVTNMIPFFGPIIGAIPSAILILLTQPNKVIAFVIFVIVLQQFDGNILGPKILGNSTGLPSFWVMFAIFIGGGLFNFVGMLLGVPVFAVIYTLVKRFITYRLEKKSLPVSTSEYKPGAVLEFPSENQLPPGPPEEEGAEEEESKDSFHDTQK